MKAQERFDHQLAIMQAIKEGKTVQTSGGCCGCNWRDWDGILPAYEFLNFQNFEWRIKPEPVELEVWINQKSTNVYSYQSNQDVKSWESNGWRRIKVREVLED